MECPRCQSVLPCNASPSCDRCGFSLSVLCRKLGDQWVRLERLTDAAHCLRMRDSRKIDALLDEFERRFPQVFLAVYFGVLPHGVSVAEAGFWLLNHAAFATHDTSKRNEYGLVLVTDPAVGQSAISMGYTLERFIRRRDLDRMLLRMSTALAHSEYGEAVQIAIRRIDRMLRSAGSARPMESNPSHAPAVGGDLGLRRLRTNHRPPNPVADAAPGPLP